jgi:catechol 2,3-dioxygenase-like lactoylglutathione lyase family enzyme
MSEFPPDGLAVTQIIVVRDLARSMAWYLHVLGASLYGEYGGTSLILQLGNAWLLVVTGGAPTEDKPGVTLEPPLDPDRVDHLITMRVTDCQAAYDELRGRGAAFLTPPVFSGPETRAFFRDPDGHLFEISEYRAGSPADDGGGAM